MIPVVEKQVVGGGRSVNYAGRTKKSQACRQTIMYVGSCQCVCIGRIKKNEVLKQPILKHEKQLCYATRSSRNDTKTDST